MFKCDWRIVGAVGGRRDERLVWPTSICATRQEAVYVLRCFQMRTQKTRKADFELAALRFAQLGK